MARPDGCINPFVRYASLPSQDIYLPLQWNVINRLGLEPALGIYLRPIACSFNQKGLFVSVFPSKVFIAKTAPFGATLENSFHCKWCRRNTYQLGVKQTLCFFVKRPNVAHNLSVQQILTQSHKYVHIPIIQHCWHTYLLKGIYVYTVAQKNLRWSLKG